MQYSVHKLVTASLCKRIENKVLLRAHLFANTMATGVLHDNVTCGSRSGDKATRDEPR